MKALGRMTAGLLLWALVFASIYAVHGLGCARGWSEYALLGTSLQRASLLGIWLVGIVSGVVLTVAIRWDRERLTDRIGHWCAWIGSVATFASGLPAALVPVCR